MGGCVEVDRDSRVELEVGVVATHVCLCARALLVGGGEALVEARERHGKVLSDCMHFMLRLLELCSHITYNLLYVDGVVDDVVGGRINFGVGIVIDVGGELYELAIKLLFPFLHRFGKEGFGEGRIGVDVTCGLKLLGNPLQVEFPFCTIL